MARSRWGATLAFGVSFSLERDVRKMGSSSHTGKLRAASVLGIEQRKLALERGVYQQSRTWVAHFCYYGISAASSQGFVKHFTENVLLSYAALIILNHGFERRRNNAVAFRGILFVDLCRMRMSNKLFAVSVKVE